MTNSPIIAAEFTIGGRRHPPILTIVTIENGARRNPRSHIVKDKREARKVAAQFNATPWNF